VYQAVYQIGSAGAAVAARVRIRYGMSNDARWQVGRVTRKIEDARAAATSPHVFGSTPGLPPHASRLTRFQ
jgi:hypothetical protein